jgi:hypothetical protein
LLPLLALGAAGQQVIDFETNPSGAVPVDDELLVAPYALGATGVALGFDTDDDLIIDSAPRLEARGGIPSAETGAYRTGPTNNLQNDLDFTPGAVGADWILRRGDLSIDPAAGHDFLVVYSGKLPTYASGQIWDLDGGSGFAEQWRIEALDGAGAVIAALDSPFFNSKNNPPTESLDGWPWDFAFVNLPLPIQTIRCSYIGSASPDVGFAFDNLSVSGGAPVNYCTAGTSASGCSVILSASGAPSATASSGFVLSAPNVEGSKDGIFFFGSNGQQAAPWGNGTSFQCVVPPVSRAGNLPGNGTNGACDGSFSQDLNAHWCPTCPKPNQNPGAGALVQAQLWYRDPANTSNQTTSLSDAVEFFVGP